VLNSTRYYGALGALVDGALARVLGDVLALGDITAAESGALAELCRIAAALEGLFADSFVVAHVPCWLKFSYLSVLLVRVPVARAWGAADGARRRRASRTSGTCLTTARSWTLSRRSWRGSCARYLRTRHCARCSSTGSCRGTLSKTRCKDVVYIPELWRHRS
jgi:hypothetical protein